MKIFILLIITALFSACAHNHQIKQDTLNNKSKSIVVDRGDCDVIKGDIFKVYKQVCKPNQLRGAQFVCDDKLIGEATVLSLVNSKEISLDITNVTSTEEISFFEHKVSKDKISLDKK